MARYLVTGEFVDAGPLLPPQQVVQLVEQVLLPSIEALAKLEDQKRIVAGGVIAGARAGAFIVEVASNAELNRLLMELPMWGLIKWTTTPLLSFRERAADEKAAIERVKAMMR
ncbi:MAG TPA: muconolactone Delta-isomerase family protein [bacterium]|nr:muconolactone Delta-isomerase family protein [bacterium]